MSTSNIDSIYAETARNELKAKGYMQAATDRLRMRNGNDPGTPSYQFHDAVWREILIQQGENA